MNVAPGVHQLSRGHVNWWAIEDGGRVTLVDAGLRGQWDELEPALQTIGRSLSDVEAVLLTHAHPDHTGFAEQLRRRGAEVHVHTDDVAMARSGPPRPSLSQALGVLSWLRRPEFARTSAFFLREGLLRPERIVEVRSFEDGEVVDVPGRPRVVHLPGHTAGSAGLLLEDRDVVFTGDALVTWDPYSGRTGPRLMARASNDDSLTALESLRRVQDVTVRAVLPGHGPAWAEGAAEAARLATAAGAA